MPKENLFDNGSDDEDQVSFKTQNEYAKKYDNWREKEELHKLEQKYGSNPDENPSSSDSEDESDEPLEVTEEMDTQFLKTLSLLKTKDPRIYDPTYKFFDDMQVKKDDGANEEVKITKKEDKKKSLADAFAESDDDDDGGDIFKVEKKAPQANKKDGKLKEFLKGEVEKLGDAEEKDLAPLRALWSDPNINENEAFLRDYILKKRYMDTSDSKAKIDQLRDDEELQTDEQLVEEQGKFERAYNFRFEEPDQEYLKRYPRTMSTVRPKDDSRSKKRLEVKTRKEQEKLRKMEEINRMKALKLKEIQEKIEKIKQVTGNEELAFKDEDLEGDFDPDEHDKRMKAIFDEQYYGEADDEKPVFPDIDEELEIENWEKYLEGDGDGEQVNAEAHCEDEDFNMDAEYDPKKARTTLLEELKETLTNKRRNRKKKSKLAKLLEREKPKFLPSADKTYDDYMKEYYDMDCEDIIAGEIPTRFKYREVVPNSFGLTVEEILLADDKELNRWASLKKTVKHRPEHIEKSEVKTYQQKAQDEQLKKKMLPSLFKDIQEEPEIVIPVEENKKKKKKNKSNPETEVEIKEDLKEKEDVNKETNDSIEENSQNVHIEDNKVVDSLNDVSKDKKKKKKRNKNKNKQNTSINQSTEEIKPIAAEVIQETHKKEQHNSNENKKRNKKKNKANASINQSNDNKPVETETVKPKDKKGDHDNTSHKVVPSQSGEVTSKNNRKRKADFPPNKSKKVKKENKQNGGPMGGLSDERLKAFGLNPKKYRSFLKYKKF